MIEEDNSSESIKFIKIEKGNIENKRSLEKIEECYHMELATNNALMALIDLLNEDHLQVQEGKNNQIINMRYGDKETQNE